MVSSVYLRLLIFLPTTLIPPCASFSPVFCMIYSAYKLNKQGNNIQPCYTLLNNFEPLNYCMSSSNCCFLSCIQVSQEADKMVWYSHFFKTFPQFALIHTVKGFSVVNDASRCFSGIPVLFLIQRTLPIWSLVPLPFLNPACTSGSSWFTYCLSLAWRILSITLLACEN